MQQQLARNRRCLSPFAWADHQNWIFSAIAPLPDNLSEYQFAGILGSRSLRITKALTQDLMVPAEADIVIEGYCIPGETRLEGPFGDHFGFYSLTGQYPVMHVTAITARKDAVLPATIVGLPPMEDGYLGEAIGKSILSCSPIPAQRRKKRPSATWRLVSTILR